MAVALNLALNDSVGGVIPANLLEMGVFDRHSIFSQLCESAVHNDGGVIVANLQSVLHSGKIIAAANSCGLAYFVLQH